MEEAIQKFIRYFHKNKKSSANTEVSYKRDLEKLMQYLQEELHITSCPPGHRASSRDRPRQPEAYAVGRNHEGAGGFHGGFAEGNCFPPEVDEPAV